MWIGLSDTDRENSTLLKIVKKVSIFIVESTVPNVFSKILQFANIENIYINTFSVKHKPTYGISFQIVQPTKGTMREATKPF